MSFFRIGGREGLRKGRKDLIRVTIREIRVFFSQGGKVLILF